MRKGKVLSLGDNPNGRTFVCGDIHGCFEDIMNLLGDVDFDEDKDRLICTGDLIDRGSDSHVCAHLVEQSWFYTVLGNHEELLLETIIGGSGNPNRMKYLWIQNGGQWHLSLHDRDLQDVATLFAWLPLAIEFTVDDKLYVVMHADPLTPDWNISKGYLEQMSESYDPEPMCDPKLDMLYEKAIWSRSMVEDDLTITGCHEMIHGHTIHDKATRRGNRLFLDTGSFCKYWDGYKGGISLYNVNTGEIHYGG